MPTERCYSNSVSERSFDHPIRPRQHVGRNREADLLRCFQIDHQLEFRRLFDRKVGRLCSFKNFVDHRGYTPLRLTLTRSIRHQATYADIVAPRVYRRQLILSCQLHDLFSIRSHQRMLRHRECGTKRLIGVFERALEFIRGAYFHRENLQAEISCR